MVGVIPGRFFRSAPSCPAPAGGGALEDPCSSFSNFQSQAPPHGPSPPRGPLLTSPRTGPWFFLLHFFSLPFPLSFFPFFLFFFKRQFPRETNGAFPTIRRLPDFALPARPLGHWAGGLCRPRHHLGNPEKKSPCRERARRAAPPLFVSHTGLRRRGNPLASFQLERGSRQPVFS